MVIGFHGHLIIIMIRRKATRFDFSIKLLNSFITHIQSVIAVVVVILNTIISMRLKGIRIGPSLMPSDNIHGK